MVDANLIANYLMTQKMSLVPMHCLVKPCRFKMKNSKAYGDGLHPNSTESMETNKFVTLTADVLFINNLPFVVTFGQGMGLLTAEFTPT